MGVFDRLQRQLDDKSQEGGISAIDIASLPPALRRIMRLMLRELEMNRAGLLEAIQAMAEEDRLSEAELDEALAELSKQQWLIRFGEGERASYKVNLRRKAGSTLAGSIWASLEDKIETKPPDKPEDETSG